ncbi:Hypothetical predicted protein, partial [Mytilus galloprovincialis]
SVFKDGCLVTSERNCYQHPHTSNSAGANDRWKWSELRCGNGGNGPNLGVEMVEMVQMIGGNGANDRWKWSELRCGNGGNGGNGANDRWKWCGNGANDRWKWSELRCGNGANDRWKWSELRCGNGPNLGGNGPNLGANDRSKEQALTMRTEYEIQVTEWKTHKLQTLRPVRSMKRAVVFRDDFNSFNKNDYKIDCTAWGGGNGEFQVYVPEDANLFTRDGSFFLKPTLTVDHKDFDTNRLFHGRMNLKGEGTKSIRRTYSTFKIYNISVT